MRQGVDNRWDPGPGVSIATLSWEYSPDFSVPEHAHGSDQLIHAIRGVMEVSAGQRLWTIPPQLAIWIPARTPHSIRMSGAVSMRTLYLKKGLASRMPAECAVLNITSLLRELIVEAVRVGELRTRTRLDVALRDLIVAAIHSAPFVPTFITLPRDDRALKVARRLIAEPGLRMGQVCGEAAVSARTIERVFRRDVGISFEAWRRQLRLMRGIELLAGGEAVKEAAFAVGYEQPSAFVQMFRRTMGVTPKTWTLRLIANELQSTLAKQ